MTSISGIMEFIINVKLIANPILNVLGKPLNENPGQITIKAVILINIIINFCN